MSNVTWNELTPVLQETLQAIATGKWVFVPNAQKLQDMGLVGEKYQDDPQVGIPDYYVKDAGRALLPMNGEAVDTWAKLTQDELDMLGITREQAEQFDRELVETINMDTTVSGCTRCHTRAAVVRGLCVDCAGVEIELGIAAMRGQVKAWERVKALEAENARLQNQIHLYKDAANLAGMQYGLERENSQLLYRTLQQTAPEALAQIKAKLNHSNTEGDKVLGEYTRRVQDMSIALKPFADLMPEWFARRDDDSSTFDEFFNAVVEWELVEDNYTAAFEVYNKYIK